MFFINQRLTQGYICNLSRVRRDGLVEAVPADLAIMSRMKPPPMQHDNQCQIRGWTHAEHILHLNSNDAWINRNINSVYAGLLTLLEIEPNTSDSITLMPKQGFFVSCLHSEARRALKQNFADKGCS